MQDAEEFTPLHPDVLSAPEMAGWVQSGKKKIGEVEMQKESSPSWRLTRGSTSGGAGSSGAEKGEACHLLPGLLSLLLLVGCHWHAGWICRVICKCDKKDLLLVSHLMSQLERLFLIQT